MKNGEMSWIFLFIFISDLKEKKAYPLCFEIEIGDTMIIKTGLDRSVGLGTMTLSSLFGLENRHTKELGFKSKNR